jgi:hypothetical protein
MMSVTYDTNFMGPVSLDWYRKRGLTHKVAIKLNEDQAVYPEGLGPGDVWEYDDITLQCACGRIDIRDDSKDGYDGWDEYSIAPMPAEDWDALGDWLWNLETEEQLSYDELIERFELSYGKSIRWIE